jgi:hypothetical protein
MATKVSQKTIDDIKKMGMTKALASAKTNRSAEYQEALRRMYGERRVKEAMRGSQGGSASRETYMKRGYSGAPTSPRKKTSAGPKMGGGQGYKSSATSSRTKMGAKGKAGLGIAAAAAAAGGGVYAKGKSIQKKIASMTPTQQAAYAKKATKRVESRVKKVAKSPVGKAAAKVAKSPVGKVAGKVVGGRVGAVMTVGTVAASGVKSATQAVKKTAAKAKAKKKAK